jgi:hypothetical protein
MRIVALVIMFVFLSLALLITFSVIYAMCRDGFWPWKRQY